VGDIWSIDKFQLFIAFVLPGFISLQVYRLFIAGDDSDITRKLPAIISYSAMHYALFGWVILISREGGFRTLATYLVVLVFPVAWPPLILLARDAHKWSQIFWPPSRLLSEMLRPEATPWDRVRQRFVRITRGDGSFVGGYLADGSQVSTYPNERQIYIRNEHLIDQATGEIGDRIDSTGILVTGEEIRLIELIDSE
jgi:uncharacterized protein DUF6338